MMRQEIPADVYRIAYRSHGISMTSGYLSDWRKAFDLAHEMAEFEHVTQIDIQKIEHIERVKP